MPFTVLQCVNKDIIIIIIITNYNSIYSQLTVCTLSCTLPHKVSIEHTAIMQP